MRLNYMHCLTEVQLAFWRRLNRKRNIFGLWKIACFNLIEVFHSYCTEILIRVERGEYLIKFMRVYVNLNFALIG